MAPTSSSVPEPPSSSLLNRLIELWPDIFVAVSVTVLPYIAVTAVRWPTTTSLYASFGGRRRGFDRLLHLDRHARDVTRFMDGLSVRSDLSVFEDYRLSADATEELRFGHVRTFRSLWLGGR
jgi:hypothetical protein